MNGLLRGSGSIDIDIQAIIIMEKFKRTYEEYMNTPKRIIDKINIKRESESEFSKKINK